MPTKTPALVQQILDLMMAVWDGTAGASAKYALAFLSFIYPAAYAAAKALFDVITAPPIS